MAAEKHEQRRSVPLELPKRNASWKEADALEFACRCARALQAGYEFDERWTTIIVVLAFMSSPALN
jgi:hypothetical protein